MMGAGTKMCILRFQFTKTSSGLDAAHGDRLSNALQLTRFILTCRCGGKSEGLARRCVNSNGGEARPKAEVRQTGLSRWRIEG